MIATIALFAMIFAIIGIMLFEVASFIHADWKLKKMRREARADAEFRLKNVKNVKKIKKVTK